MKKRVVFFGFFVLFFLPLVSAEWMHDSSSADIELAVSSQMVLTSTGSGPNIDYINAKLSFFPQTFNRQSVLSLKSTPVSEISDDVMLFSWDSPSLGTLPFGFSSTVRTNDFFPKINKKISFPISSDNVFSESSDNIDSDNQLIINQASELAEGHDDLFILVSSLAQWTADYVVYDLSCGDRVEKASWVLKNKKGTCDEFASLFIALCRSLNIPAKYVSGIAYSNIQEIQGFGAHAWAEVYFKDFGWVSFDPTYNQFGFVDLSHVKLKESFDSDDPSTRFEWKAGDIDLDAESLDIVAILRSSSGFRTPLYSLAISTKFDDVGFGSYNLVEVKINNPNNFYLIDQFQLAKSPETIIIGESFQSIVLKPGESKSIFWKVRVNSGLDDGFVYHLPVAVYSSRNVSSESSFSASENGDIFSLDDIDFFEEPVLSLTKNLEIICEQDNQFIYLNNEKLVSCRIQNKGNANLNNLRVCLQSVCKSINLPIAQKQFVNLSFTPFKIGNQEVKVTASNSDIEESFPLIFDVLDEPKVTITDFVHPFSLEQMQDYNISFILGRGSYSEPKNVFISVDGSKELEIPSLDGNLSIKLTLKPDNLNKGENNVFVSVHFQDFDGNDFVAKQEFMINLENISFFQRVRLFFNDVFISLLDLFSFQ